MKSIWNFQNESRRTATLSRFNLAASSLTSFTINQKKELLELRSTTNSNILTPAEEHGEELNIDFINVMHQTLFKMSLNDLGNSQGHLDNLILGESL